MTFKYRNHSWSLVVTRSHSWSLVVTRGHSWSLVVTRGNSWSLVVTRGHSCVLLDKTVVEIFSSNKSAINPWKVSCKNTKLKKSVVGYIFLDIDILSYPMVN